MLSRREMIHGGAAAAAAMIATAARAQMHHMPGPAGTADELAQRLVAAMGGGESWAPLQGLSVRARHYETAVPEPYDNALYIALAELRMRFDATVSGVRRLRAVVGDKGWRTTGTAPPVPLAAEIVQSDREWWETHVYRNVWRLARRDPALNLRRHADGRLELYGANGKRLMWYRLNQHGEPVGFGRFDSDVTATILGPLQPVSGGVRLPIFSASSDGSFRAVDQRATVYTSVPPVDFDKP